MGACVSTPEGCVGGKFKKSSKRKNRRRRRKGSKTTVFSALSDGSHRSEPIDHCSFSNPTFQGFFLFYPSMFFFFFFFLPGEQGEILTLHFFFLLVSLVVWLRLFFNFF